MAPGAGICGTPGIFPGAAGELGGTIGALPAGACPKVVCATGLGLVPG